MPLQARAEFAVLAALEECGPLSQADLGRRLGLDRNNVNDIVGRLHTTSRVIRSIDPADRRRNTVAMTEEGRLYLDELQAVTDQVQAELTEALSNDERAQLRALLEKLLSFHPTLPS
ncbi:MarR family winged helix-turn-helix transcriptional regulator [Paramicrobacterium fandaimingii]|uniref:MarR family winged helix-turn-helix transcriptional regulator n=1 Tax=Paramicrobacterium fandaimingii TaxID=2708079 RepID=UPI001C3FED12|nr:MarR family winged helix-turn-helix transcriptional regulator [Microbacterium fandaimingii]